MYSNKFSNRIGTSSGIGGTKIASSIVHPLGPIQFCIFLIFPGSFSLPLTLSLTRVKLLSSFNHFITFLAYFFLFLLLIKTPHPLPNIVLAPSALSKAMQGTP